MIILKATTEILELTTSVAGSIDYYTSSSTVTSSTATPTSSFGNVTTATTTTIVSAPGASEQKSIELISIENKGTASNTVTLKIDNSGTEYYLYSATLQPGENLTYVKGNGFDKHSRSGDDTSYTITDKTKPLSATSFNLLKVGGTTEAAGVMHFMGLATGVPGAWSPGSPGINGRATNGTTAGDAGCIPIKNPSSGANFLTSYVPTATTASAQFLLDVLWVNTGIAVTTTTAQSITSATLPDRDATGTTNGENVMMGILVTTATTNASAVTNTTASYTDSDGNAGNTATISSFPATAAAGTLVPFQLASGDKGVRSVQSITLGTSYGGGAISLVLYRIVAGAPVLIANAGGKLENPPNVNVRLYNGACVLPAYIPTATTATNIFASINVEEK